ncbi:MAG: ABC transporter permease [Janthinobacterium lividum]
MKTPAVFSRRTRILHGCTGVLVFVLVWKATGVLGWVNPGILPDPFQLPHTLLQELHSNRLLPAVGSSLIHYAWGLGLGALCGIMVALAAATLPRFDMLQAYVARILRPIPPLAWVVFAIAWFKVSHAGAAFVIAIGVFWVNYFATYTVVRNVDPRFYELARSFGQGSYWRRLLSITLPAIAPGLLSGFRTGIGQAWMTLIAAELLGVPGMGQEMNAAAGVGAYDAVVVYMLTISAVYAATDLLYLVLEKSVLSWRP